MKPKSKKLQAHRFIELSDNTLYIHTFEIANYTERRNRKKKKNAIEKSPSDSSSDSNDLQSLQIDFQTNLSYSQNQQTIFEDTQNIIEDQNIIENQNIIEDQQYESLYGFTFTNNEQNNSDFLKGDLPDEPFYDFNFN